MPNMRIKACMTAVLPEPFEPTKADKSLCMEMQVPSGPKHLKFLSAIDSMYIYYSL